MAPPANIFIFLLASLVSHSDCTFLPSAENRRYFDLRFFNTCSVSNTVLIVNNNKKKKNIVAQIIDNSTFSRPPRLNGLSVACRRGRRGRRDCVPRRVDQRPPGRIASCAPDRDHWRRDCQAAKKSHGRCFNRLGAGRSFDIQSDHRSSDGEIALWCQSS
jgi:hypothetical protein